MMKATTRSHVDLKEFLEIVLMWHCSGDIPMNRVTMVEFIEDSYFREFLRSVHHWSLKFGLTPPSTTDVVKTLHTLY